MSYQLPTSEEFTRLFNAVYSNLNATLDYLVRLRDRHGYLMEIPLTGKPGHVLGRPNGPYWGILKPDPRLGKRKVKPLPLAVVDEGKALSIQGLRLRKEVLGLWPDCDLVFLFPLNLYTHSDRE